MSHQANTDFAQAVVDGLEFVRQSDRLSGEIAIAALDRLADSLAGNAGSLKCAVQGGVDQEGNSFLILAVSGTLQLRCQRCLERMTYALQIDKRLLLVAPGRAWPDEALEDDEFDAIEAGKTMALLPLIEEEVLLALPIAPRHEVCEPPVMMDKDREPSAFAVLAQFRKH